MSSKYVYPAIFTPEKKAGIPFHFPIWRVATPAVIIWKTVWKWLKMHLYFSYMNMKRLAKQYQSHQNVKQ